MRHWLARVSLALGLGPALAYADSEIHARLELVAPADCATLSELEQRVAIRSDRIRFVEEPERVRALRAEIKPIDERTVAATLNVVEPDGRRSARRILTHTCDEALDALALVVAVTLDPNSAFSAPVPPRETTSAPLPSTPAPSTSQSVAPPPPPSASPPPNAPTLWLPSAGISFEGIYGPPPGVLPGGSVYLRLDWERHAPISPSFVLTGSHFQRDGYHAKGGGVADFALDQLKLEACPLRQLLAKGQRLTQAMVHYCAMGTGGILRAGGVQSYDPRTRRRPWWVLGGSAVLTVRPTDILDIIATVSLGYPLIRDKFRFNPPNFYEVKGISLTSALGVGLTLP